jgi:hypothetical protein
MKKNEKCKNAAGSSFFILDFHFAFFILHSDHLTPSSTSIVSWSSNS